MKQKILKSIFLFFFASMLSAVASAGEYGTPEEAKAMVKKAVLFAKSNNKDAFLAEVSNPKGKFVDRDLYISVYDFNGVVVAHGVNPKLIGKDVSTLNDVDGKFFIKEILTKAKADGQGTSDYKWPHPATKQYQAKSVYFEVINGLIVSSGYYKY
ncbi:MAG TPA: cache domain-containing protein [Noviherbaspirillum sp.]|nr:cache domain-containing protein [Noviherbaspirillum sp.]